MCRDLEPKQGKSKIEILVAAVEALLDGQKSILAGPAKIMADQAEQRSMLREIARRMAG